MTKAASSAVFDLGDDIRRCMAAADTFEPNLQYVLDLRFDGHPAVGTLIQEVELKRITGPDQLTDTLAQKCVADLLALVELPPSAGRSAMMTVFRYDGCSTKYDVGRTHAQTYARAFPKWLAAHPNQGCPSRLEELRSFAEYKVPDVDPWGHPYRWRCQSDRPEHPIDVSSAGRDGVVGTEDDVTSWK